MRIGLNQTQKLTGALSTHFHPLTICSVSVVCTTDPEVALCYGAGWTAFRFEHFSPAGLIIRVFSNIVFQVLPGPMIRKLNDND